jgi:hypothetical protein
VAEVRVGADGVITNLGYQTERDGRVMFFIEGGRGFARNQNLLFFIYIINNY